MSDNLLKIKYDGHVRVNIEETGKCLKTKKNLKFEFQEELLSLMGVLLKKLILLKNSWFLKQMVRDYASVNWAASKAVVQK